MATTHRCRKTIRNRFATATAALAFVVIITGCMSLSIGGRTNQVVSSSSTEDGVYQQEGTAHLKGGGDADVYYPVPYQRPPNLELTNDDHHCEIVEQKEDHFRVHNGHAFHEDIHWKARGLRVVARTGPIPAPAPSPAAEPVLPPPSVSPGTPPPPSPPPSTTSADDKGKSESR